MEIIKKYIVGIVLFFVLVIIWGGLLLISNKTFSEVNPNAKTYTKSLAKSFDIETLEEVTKRMEDSFPVLPSEFFILKEGD